MIGMARMLCPFLLSWTAVCGGIEDDAAAAMPSRLVELEFSTPHPSDITWIARTVYEDPYLAQAARADLDGDGSLDTIVVAGGRQCSAAGCPTWVHFSSGLVTELGDTWLLEGESGRVVFGTVPHAPPMLAPRGIDGKAFVPEGHDEGDVVHYSVLPLGNMPTRIVARRADDPAPE
jgi:hypothetical protein